MFLLFQRKLKQSTVKNKIQPEFFFCINGGDQNLFTGQTKQFCHRTLKTVNKGDKCNDGIKSTYEF